MSAQLLDRVYQAELAVERLVKLKVDVERVDIVATRPRIWLRGRNDDLHKRFGGGIHLILPTTNEGRVAVMAARFEGCQLYWRRKL